MEAEYRILQRITGHSDKFNTLFRSFDVEFKRRNRYAAVIPFKFNRVKLNTAWTKSNSTSEAIEIGNEAFTAYADMNKDEQVTDDLNKYINASWINSATQK